MGAVVGSGEGRLVTPEAVALDLQTATVATRGLAATLDIVLQGVAFVLVSLAGAFLSVDSAPTIVFVVAVLLAVLLIRLGYPVLMETRFGATLGHMAMGLRVVTLDGAPIRARQAMARAAVGLFELDATFGVVALLVAAAREDGRRLGDLAGGTQLVSVRTGTGPAEAVHVTMPPRLAGWAATLDTSDLGPRERAALRRYLTRADGLATATRDDLAEGLVDKLLPRLAATRPGGEPDHDVLRAIAAAAKGDRAVPRGLRRTDLPAPGAPPPAPPSLPGGRSPTVGDDASDAAPDGSGFRPPG